MDLTKKSFRALVVNKTESGTSTGIERLPADSLPPGNVLVSVEYSTLNYKDGLCLGSGGGLVKSYPHIPGIDFAGTVEESDDARYQKGDRVVLTGWRIGEVRWGGYATLASVDGDWPVRLPKTMSTRTAMIIGTAGLTAMFAVNALENHGLKPENGPVLVTGAAGGVGSVAVAILAALGYSVAAVTGRQETADYLTKLGASEIIPRIELNEVSKRPLESEKWAGCVDSVGGVMLSRALKQMKHSASVAAVGLAGGADVPASVIPFLLRGINLLGIDSVMQPHENRVAAWDRLAELLPADRLEKMALPVGLEELPELGKAILAGQVKGRVVVDVNA